MHTCVFTPLPKIRRLYFFTLYCIYSRTDYIHIFKESCTVSIFYAKLHVRSCVCTEQNMELGISPVTYKVELIPSSGTCSILYSGSQTRLNTANHIFLSVQNAVSQCLCNDLLLKQISRIRNSKTCHVFISISHEYKARQIWVL